MSLNHQISNRIESINTIKVVIYVSVILSLLVLGSLIYGNENSRNSILLPNQNSLLETVPDYTSNTETPYQQVQNHDDLSDKSTEDSVSISGDSVEVEIDPSSTAEQNKSSLGISIDVSNGSGSYEENIDNENKPSPSLSINGNEVAIPENGRLRETIKDENTTTRLRTNIESDGSSSININTKSNN